MESREEGSLRFGSSRGKDRAAVLMLLNAGMLVSGRISLGSQLWRCPRLVDSL
ncbi:hypothetical protein DICSQDRAFT_141193 [Dichomitus squalens LYAD-421 SS1]|uniref:Uncharacterized protein n=1 Tax=Dichomitus squalens (strain LYAD-421) TaxID=732165 RepID=R7SKA2_DICSQ|nr:uncharacterized protein DICSQDRAFT_141193 [Dichomitus squalens LYAD-421 SS1]EJF56576.1 hypothetical protein DICSQDRAFT_141193 [Dichomitus squalens LYAD-421 SS1]